VTPELELLRRATEVVALTFAVRVWWERGMRRRAARVEVEGE
jgi:hypothetical protein